LPEIIVVLDQTSMIFRPDHTSIIVVLVQTSMIVVLDQTKIKSILYMIKPQQKNVLDLTVFTVLLDE
jgi:hypothetical protein